eukprot:Skav226389  [mRNA]  locus=scaffold1631:59004:62396:+ [translate_table: standard]
MSMNVENFLQPEEKEETEEKHDVKKEKDKEKEKEKEENKQFKEEKTSVFEVQKLENAEGHETNSEDRRVDSEATVECVEKDLRPKKGHEKDEKDTDTDNPIGLLHFGDIEYAFQQLDSGSFVATASAKKSAAREALALLQEALQVRLPSRQSGKPVDLHEKDPKDMKDRTDLRGSFSFVNEACSVAEACSAA